MSIGDDTTVSERGVVMATKETPVITVHGERISLAAALRRSDVSPIVRRFGTWAVTEYGVECLAHYYPIRKERLWQAYPWERHMATKRWVVQEDLRPALIFGRL